MRRLAAALLAAASALVALVPPAGAADSIVIRKLDFTAFPKVTISALVSGETPPLDSFTLRENGTILTEFDVVPIAKTDTPVGVVLVLDVSASMREGDKLVSAKEAAKQFVAQKPPKDQIAVVAFSDVARVVSGFTGDVGRLNQAIDGLAAGGGTALLDAVSAAATLFGDRPDLQANVVVLSDGNDTASQSGVEQAQASLLGVHAALFAVGLRGGEFDAGPLQRLAGASGGQYTETTDPGSLKALYDNVQRALQNQFEVTYTSSATGSATVDLAAGGVRTSAGPVSAGSVSQGAGTRPEAVGSSWFAGPLGSPVSLVLIAAIAFVAAGFIVISIGALSRQGLPTLSSRLKLYGPEGGAAFEASAEGDKELAQTAVVRRAVAATARLARGRGILETVEAKLEQADLPVRPAEALFFYVAGVFVGVVLGAFLNGFFGAALALIFLGLIPPAVLNALGARRRARFSSQLPDMLRLMSSSLRAGFSLLQAADASADQVGDPMGAELRRVLVEARLGRPLELALQDSAKRVQSKDYDWAVMAISIQREVGGNLAELLSTVSETMVARERLRREINTLTAEGRISSLVLAVLPVAIGFIVYTLNPSYLDPLLHTTTGQVMLLGALAVGTAGFVWMRKIIDIPT